MDKLRNYISSNPKGGAVLLIGVPVAVCAGIYFGIEYTRRKKSPALEKPMSLVALHGGQVALQRLVNYHREREKLDKAQYLLQRLLEDSSKFPHVKKLQSAVAKLEMTNRDTIAAKILEEAFKKASEEGRSHEAYEIEMSLVEMLVYMGKWQEASKRKCLEEQHITDARRPLFLAIIHSMAGEIEESRKCWENFQEIRQSLNLPHNLESDGPRHLASDFNELKKIVELLQYDAKKLKT